MERMLSRQTRLLEANQLEGRTADLMSEINRFVKVLFHLDKLKMELLSNIGRLGSVANADKYKLSVSV